MLTGADAGGDTLEGPVAPPTLEALWLSINPSIRVKTASGLGEEEPAAMWVDVSRAVDDPVKIHVITAPKHDELNGKVLTQRIRCHGAYKISHSRELGCAPDLDVGGGGAAAGVVEMLGKQVGTLRSRQHLGQLLLREERLVIEGDRDRGEDAALVFVLSHAVIDAVGETTRVADMGWVEGAAVYEKTIGSFGSEHGLLVCANKAGAPAVAVDAGILESLGQKCTKRNGSVLWHCGFVVKSVGISGGVDSLCDV